jgi:glutaredoxin
MKKVMIYALSTCPWCMKTKQFMRDNNVEFDSIDYDLADDAMQEKIVSDMRKRGGGDGFPFIIIGDEIIIGYNPDKMAKALGIKK